MSTTAAGVLFVVSMVAALAVAYRPAGRILLPVWAIAAVVLVAGGAVQNMHGNPTFTSTWIGSPRCGAERAMLEGSQPGG